ncbi:7-cyano-7-deazaguanine synthase [Candidatus Daviesbacteria bacterium]|nr:7-cyano-7-deazaguanine synthase [Candidatus Daviesbacteria bacterium]
MITPESKPLAVCLVSGGLDSAVAVAVAQRDGFQTRFLFVEYGQKTASKERRSATTLAAHFQAITLDTVRLPWLKRFGGSGLFRRDVELNESNERFEYVPFRNSILLAVGVVLAEVSGADRVYIGSTGSDRICPDNSPEFMVAFQQLTRLGTMLKTDIQIIAPLIHMNKAQVVQTGTSLNVPFELTWSCHNATKLSCGGCSNCRSRQAAFQSLGLTDPLKYNAK